MLSLLFNLYDDSPFFYIILWCISCLRAAGFLQHAYPCRFAHHHYHMFKQQVPYVPLPLAPAEPKELVRLMGSHHHPRLTDQNPGRWTLIAVWHELPEIFTSQLLTVFKPPFFHPLAVRESPAQTLSALLTFTFQQEKCTPLRFGPVAPWGSRHCWGNALVQPEQRGSLPS